MLIYDDFGDWVSGMLNVILFSYCGSNIFKLGIYTRSESFFIRFLKNEMDLKLRKWKIRFFSLPGSYRKWEETAIWIHELKFFQRNLSILVLSFQNSLLCNLALFLFTKLKVQKSMCRENSLSVSEKRTTLKSLLWRFRLSQRQFFPGVCPCLKLLPQRRLNFRLVSLAES